jgi:hypothetical protein
MIQRPYLSDNPDNSFKRINRKLVCSQITVDNRIIASYFSTPIRGMNP